jgi:CheY-like chemotaxis protein
METVLIVEDELTTRDALIELLEKDGRDRLATLTPSQGGHVAAGAVKQ